MAYFPRDMTFKQGTSDVAQKDTKRWVYHECLRIVMDPLKRASFEEVELLCPTGQSRTSSGEYTFAHSFTRIAFRSTRCPTDDGFPQRADNRTGDAAQGRLWKCTQSCYTSAVTCLRLTSSHVASTALTPDGHVTSATCRRTSLPKLAR